MFVCSKISNHQICHLNPIILRMKYFLRILAILLPMMLLYSCSDDSLGGEPDLPSDIYVGPYRNFTPGPEAEGLSAKEVDVTFLSDSGEMFTRSATAPSKSIFL